MSEKDIKTNKETSTKPEALEDSNLEQISGGFEKNKVTFKPEGKSNPFAIGKSKKNIAAESGDGSI